MSGKSSIMENPIAMSAIVGIVVYFVLEQKLIKIDLPEIPVIGLQMEPMHAGLAAAAAYYIITEYAMGALAKSQGDLGFYDY